MEDFAGHISVLVGGIKDLQRATKRLKPQLLELSQSVDFLPDMLGSAPTMSGDMFGKELDLISRSTEEIENFIDEAQRSAALLERVLTSDRNLRLAATEVPPGLKKGDYIEVIVWDRKDADADRAGNVHSTYRVVRIEGPKILGVDFEGHKAFIDVGDRNVKSVHVLDDDAVHKFGGAATLTIVDGHLEKLMITASDFEDALKESKFEEGKPADPTKNMSKEDAAEWKRQTEEHKDEFKTAGVPEDHQLKILKDTVKNPMKGKFLGGPSAEEAEKTLREKFHFTDKQITTLKKASVGKIASVTVGAIASLVAEELGAFSSAIKKTEDTLETIKDSDTDWKIWGKNSEGEDFEATLTVTGNGYYSLYVSTQLGSRMGFYIIGPHERDPSKINGALRGYTDLTWDMQGSTRPRLASIKDYEVALRVASPGDSKESKFEEGKPADPTENMSKEDAAEWKRQNEEHKDEFKTAKATYVDPSIVGAKRVVDEARKELDLLWSKGPIVSGSPEANKAKDAYRKFEEASRDLMDTYKSLQNWRSATLSVDDYAESLREAKFPKDKSMTVDEVSEVVGPEFKEMNEDPPESVKKLQKEMQGKSASEKIAFHSKPAIKAIRDYYLEAMSKPLQESLGKALSELYSGPGSAGDDEDGWTYSKALRDLGRWWDSVGTTLYYDTQSGLVEESLPTAYQDGDEMVEPMLEDYMEFSERDGAKAIFGALITDGGMRLGSQKASRSSDVSKREWQRALKTDEDMLVSLNANIKKLESGETVENLTLENAKLIKGGLEQVIENKKNLIKKFANLSDETTDKTAEWKGWDEDMPVQVASEHGSEVFENLADARRKYPELDPKKGGGGFHWAMRGEVKGRPAIRFESHGLYRAISRDASVHEAAAGLYGFTKEAERVCGSATNKLAKFTAKLAKDIYSKDAETPGFLEEHTTRTASKAARMLRASMADIGPGKPSKTAAYNPWIKELGGTTDFSSIEVGKSFSFPKSEEVLTKISPRKYRDSSGHSFATGSGTSVVQIKTAAKSGKGRYGFSAKTAKLALEACHEVEHQAGVVASDLHTRMGAKHASITGFLNKHAKRAKCGWSDMILEAYPTPDEAEVLASKSASLESYKIHPTVDEILSWDGKGGRLAASFLASEEEGSEDKPENEDDNLA
jgi:hypothetical protein